MSPVEAISSHYFPHNTELKVTENILTATNEWQTLCFSTVHKRYKRPLCNWRLILYQSGTWFIIDFMAEKNVSAVPRLFLACQVLDKARQCNTRENLSPIGVWAGSHLCWFNTTPMHGRSAMSHWTPLQLLSIYKNITLRGLGGMPTLDFHNSQVFIHNEISPCQRHLFGV